MIEKKSPPLLLVIFSLVFFGIVISFVLYQAKKQRNIINQERNERGNFENQLNELVKVNDSLSLAQFLTKMPDKWRDDNFKEDFLLSAIVANNLPAIQLSEKYGVNLRTPLKGRKQLHNSHNVFYWEGNWLHFAVSQKCKLEIIQYFIQKGISKTQKITCTRSPDCDPKLSNEQGCPNLGKTPLDLAMEAKVDSTIIQILK